MQLAIRPLLKKETVEKALVVGLSLVLLVVLRARFGGAKPSVENPSIRPQPAAVTGVSREADGPAGAAVDPGLKGTPRPVASRWESSETPPAIGRDLFAPLNPSDDPWGTEAGGGRGTDRQEPVLRAIFFDEKSPLAIINDEVVGVGGMVDGSQVMAIGKNEVVVSRNDIERTLHLYPEEQRQ